MPNSLKSFDVPKDIASQSAYIADSKSVHGYSPAIVRLLELSKDYAVGGNRAFKAGKSALWRQANNFAPALLIRYYSGRVRPEGSL
ncbi:MAG: hypothetical protein LBT86_07290 [Deltaproteobacteria bacterium]|jgi:hypothetical protein|nr:hypothetical protein [Deltaproteobacteria bacterium]